MTSIFLFFIKPATNSTFGSKNIFTLFTFDDLLASERSERDTLSRSSMENAIRIYIYIYIDT